jgi:anti-sigma factor RsiW
VLDLLSAPRCLSSTFTPQQQQQQGQQQQQQVPSVVSAGAAMALQCGLAASGSLIGGMDALVAAQQSSEAQLRGQPNRRTQYFPLAPELLREAWGSNPGSDARADLELKIYRLRGGRFGR